MLQQACPDRVDESGRMNEIQIANTFEMVSQIEKTQFYVCDTRATSMSSHIAKAALITRAQPPRFCP